MSAIRVSAKWTGVDKTQEAIFGLDDRLKRGAINALKATGVFMESDAKRRVIKGPKTGKIYSRKDIFHQASAPGESPASDTGTLVRSITHDVSEQEFEVALHASADYAGHLELGTRNMEERPFLRPALIKNTKKITDIFFMLLRREL